MNQNNIFFFKKTDWKTVLCKIAAILFRSQCVDHVRHHDPPSVAFNSLRSSDAYTRQLINHHWFKLWLAAGHLNQCWNIFDLNLGSKLQWNLNWNLYIFSQENASENVSGEWQPFCLGLNVLRTEEVIHWIVYSICRWTRCLYSLASVRCGWNFKSASW